MPFTVAAHAVEIPFPTLFFYPSDAPEQPQSFGPYTVRVAADAPLAEGSFPLVVISHGTGGSHLVYRDLAAHLARHGYIVAMPEHPGNNRHDNQLANRVQNLVNRPAHLKAVMDYAYASGTFGPGLQRGAAAVIGHSMGGYTALAVAGAIPTTLPHETPGHERQTLDMAPDPRVRAIVLLSPATPWYQAPGALDRVRLPILMLTAERDPHTPAGHALIVEQGLPDRLMLHHRVVANAGHFSFLSPFPAHMTKPEFPPSQDPKGFDRAAFHVEMNSEITAFLDRHLRK